MSTNPGSGDAQTALVAVVIDALRLLPGGPGQGEGPLPSEVNQVAAALLELHRLTGSGKPVLDWLTTALGQAPAGEVGDPTLAAFAIRDLLAAGSGDPETPPQAGANVADAERAAADVFATALAEADA